MNVLLSVGAKDQSLEQTKQPKGSLEEFSAPLSMESGPLPFTIRVKNTGMHFMSVKGVILVKNMFGQTVGRIDIPPTNILANSDRFLANSEEKTTSSPKVLWP